MHVRHRIAAAALLGCAALSGTFALSQTVHLGADAKKPAPVDTAAIAQRNAALDATQQSARKALAKKTPGLPKVPKVGPVAIPNLGPIVVTRVASGGRSPAQSATASRTTRTVRVKGYAADRVAELAGENASCMVNAGGDVAVCGAPRCGAWDIGVTRGDGSVMTLSLSQGGLATSGRDRRRWTVDSREMHHIIDLVTSAPAKTDLLRVTAVASSAADAEVLAKSLFICGRAEAARKADAAGVPCVLVDANGATVLAGGLA